ncbi:MAG: DUF4982 domain-containing protein [Bifidobacteriaceae bacterium]|jgi:beta-galactosidase|nr:DUF4982 domain-containing protein [Bifidobacteriaceae bacterium]
MFIGKEAMSLKTLFNDDWIVGPKVSPYAQLSGAQTQEKRVRLPYDATVERQRSADALDRGQVGYFPSGTYVYSKEFTLAQEYEDKTLILEFQGVYRSAMVYVNGAYAGQQQNGYAPFTVNITPFVRCGQKNKITVEARALKDSRWYTGAGIYRDVYLHVLNSTHLVLSSPQVVVRELNDLKAVVEVKNEIINESTHTREVRLHTDIIDRDGTVVESLDNPVTAFPGEKMLDTQKVNIEQPHKWSPDAPYLYVVKTEIISDGSVVDDARCSVGLRVVSVDAKNGFAINGESLKLRGACVHPDNGLLGAVSNYCVELRKMTKLKAAGFNAIRSAHNPISEAALRACDEIGMLVLDETFDMWTQGKNDFDYSLDFPEWWKRDVTAMVRKDFNHPSVVMYSIGNEIFEVGTPQGGVWSRRLASTIRELDSSRPITNGINGFVAVIDQLAKMMGDRSASEEPQGGVNSMMNSASDFMNKISASEVVTKATEESYSVLDVAGMNYGDARYSIDQKLFPHRVILGTETFPPHIAHNWSLVEKYSNVIGDFTWTGWDYLGEAGIGRIQWKDEPPVFEAPFPWKTAWVGDFDITGNPRPISFYRRAVFGLLDKPYISVANPANYHREMLEGQWSWSDTLSTWTWNVASGSETSVEVYSDADEIELFVNGKTVGRKPSGKATDYITKFDVKYVPGTIKAVAYTSGVEVSDSVLATADGARRLVVTKEPCKGSSADGDLCFIDIEVQDAQGVIDTTVDEAITIKISGSGELVALGSGCPNSEESASAEETTLFQGKALAIVRSTSPGSINVEVRSNGVISGSVCVNGDETNKGDSDGDEN